MEIQKIPDDLTEPQFRKFVIQVLDGFDSSIKDLGKKMDLLISQRMASVEKRVDEIQRGMLSDHELSKMRNQNRRYWISFFVALSSTAIALLTLLLRK